MPTRRSRIDLLWLDALLIALPIVLIRLPWFGNPAVHVDEEFYLFVGDRMLHGALPYVDIWDRKPIGLFLIYTAIRLLGGNGIVVYQLVATGFAIGTALLIRSAVTPFAGRGAGIAAGIFYGLFLSIFQGMGGQSPVFYNLFVAAVAVMTLREIVSVDETSLRRVRRTGCMVMLLLGLGIQIKYTVVFEGIFFGLALLWLTGRLSGWRLWLVSVNGMIWIGIALAPTLLALLSYTLAGRANAFIFANFVSIFEKTQASVAQTGGRVQAILILLSPLLLMTAHLLWTYVTAKGELRRQRRLLGWFMFGWLAAAGAGFSSVGNYYFHYTLPLIVPLALAAGLWFGSGHMARLAFAPVLAALALYVQSMRNSHYAEQYGTGRETGAIMTLVAPELKGGCLYVHDGPPILYYLTEACLVTPYPFPYHLDSLIESKSLGVDPVAEERRIIGQRPSVIVTADTPTIAPNIAVREVLDAALAHYYRLAGTVAMGKRQIEVYALRR